ncbi:MAG: Mammalian cell entry related domain protein [Candidatus Jettenia ecosi]|uniref:Mammalian cell entry related domain protein n=1 Tax=Candidatus Jettenia ecosi TaxID=2494326 RepID=A0A533QDP2_9BACT|nr:MAG: Mammalian cell entry related domain protein [Candidatus Jettenia ecosi]
MKSTSISATKVGIFFIIGIAILALLTFRLETFRKWGNYYDLIAYFKEARGLEAQNDVTLAGTKVGYVKSVMVEGDMIKVIISIQEDIVVRKGSEASIISDFLLGKSHVNITLASVSNPAYNAAEIIKTIESPSLTDMLAKVDSALASVQNISASFEGTKEVFDSFKVTGKSLDKANIKLNKLLDSTLAITEKINSGQGTLGKLIVDKTLSNKMEAIVDTTQRVLANNEQNINTTLSGLSETSESVKNLLKKIERGEGSLSKMITNDELYVEVKKLLSDMRETIQSYREQIPVGAFGSIVFSAF